MSACGRACFTSTSMAAQVCGVGVGSERGWSRQDQAGRCVLVPALLASLKPAHATPALRAHYPADGRSVRTILQHVAPRHCVLVHGAPQATAALAGFLRTELAGLHTAVHTPQAGEEVELPPETSYCLALRWGGGVGVWGVCGGAGLTGVCRLPSVPLPAARRALLTHPIQPTPLHCPCSDALMAGVRLHQIGDYRLAWVEGVVGPPALDSEVRPRWPAGAEFECASARAPVLACLAELGQQGGSSSLT